MYRYAFGSQLKKPIFFNPLTDVVLFPNGYAMELFFRRNWSEPTDTSNQNLVCLFAVLTQDDGSTSLGEWARERQIARAGAVFDNLQMLAFVNVVARELSWDMLSRLISPRGEVIETLEKSAGLVEVRDGMEIISYTCKERCGTSR